MSFVCAGIALAVTLGFSSAGAVEAVNIGVDTSVIDLTNAVELQRTDAERIQVSTAPGADGIVRHIEVRRREAGNSWAVFALANNSDDQIDRLIVAPRYPMAGCARLGAEQSETGIVNITSSSGEPPGRLKKPTTDVFRVTLDPGMVVTFVAELRGPALPQLYLWEPDALIACAVDPIH